MAALAKGDASGRCAVQRALLGGRGMEVPLGAWCCVRRLGTPSPVEFPAAAMSEIDRLQDPNFQLEVLVGPPCPELVPQAPGSGLRFAG